TLNFSAQDTLLTIEFSQALAEGSTYEITLPASVIKNTYGLSLENDFSASFTVREAVVEPFTATIVSPLNNAQNIYLNNPVVVDFSKTVNADFYFANGINTNYILISPSIAFTTSYSDDVNRLTITPNTEWAYNTQYTVTIATSTGDMEHNPLARSASVKFTTIPKTPPAVIFSSPIDKDLASRTADVVFSFTKPMDKTTFTKGTGIKIKKGFFSAQSYNFDGITEMDAAGYELHWSADNTSFEILFADGPEIAKSYQITLDSTVVACSDQIHPVEDFVSIFRVCPFDYGIGTAESPFIIASATDLININSDPDFYGKQYIQTEDIDLANYGSTYNDGAGFAPIGSSFTWVYFTGVYNGNDKKISNLYINRNSQYNGLFTKIDNAKIYNLFLENVDITSTARYIGAITGESKNSEISDVKVTGNISGDRYAAAISGRANNNTIIHRCSADVAISASNTDSLCGGIAGLLDNGAKVSHCFARVTISGNNYIGGIVGDATENTEISNCQSTGTVSGIAGGSSEFNIGGIVGRGYTTTISNCISNVTVASYYNVGGLAGLLNASSTLSNSVNMGAVTGYSEYGRVAGKLNDVSTIGDCYSKDTTVNGLTLDPADADIGLTKKHGATATAANLADSSWWTTLGWDLTTIWEISPESYPTLRDVFIAEP
ncbi:MAG: Ig-like domain-containing protein, partial [Muribaculaceae bacterium]|nr:Ig-like domain-containing protein [Muribaculaceae bacterium]